MQSIPNSVVSGQWRISLGKSLFLSSVVLTLSKKPESQFGLIVPPEAMLENVRSSKSVPNTVR